MTIIVRDNQLKELCEKIDAAGRFAMDLEFIPERTYDPELCLVQVATDDGPHIVDPLALRDLTPLWERVCSPDILTVLHAAEQDLDLIYSACGKLPQNIIDTQIAAGFAGFGYPVGYGKLLMSLTNIHLSKTESFTDWTIRPLSESQIDYALDDVRHLLPMYDRLSEKLIANQRLSWVQEECRRYSTLEQYHDDRSQDFVRVKGASSLSRKGLAVLQALCEWRDEEAYKQNRPPRFIFPDNIMLEVARKPPREPQDIQRIRGARPEQVRSYGSQVIAAVQKGLSVPEAEWPVWPAFKSPPRRDMLIVDVLFATLKIICYNIDLASELVATRGDLEHLVRCDREKKLDKQNVPILEGWRHNIAGKVMMDLLEGAPIQLHIHHGDPPVTIEINGSTHPS